MDINSIISQIEGSSTKKSANSGLDIDAILKDFNIENEPAVPIKVEPKTNSGEPKPPISGLSKESSDEINNARVKKGLPTESFDLTSPAAYEHYKSGKEMFSSGVEDLGSGHPYKGLGKTALGGLMVAGAPVSGIIDDTIGKYGNKIGPGFGDRAALIAGGAVPVVPGASTAIKVLPKTKSLRTLVESIGPENLPMVVREMKANSRLAPADLSPKVLQDTQHLFANNGPQINYLAETSANRMATRRSTIEAAYDTTGGISPDLAKKMSDLANAAKEVGSKEINPALRAASPVNVTNTLAEIDKILKPGVTSVITGESGLPLTAIKKELAQIKAFLGNDKEMRTSAIDLHKFQSGLRTTAESLMKSPVAADKELGKALFNVRANLVSDIDKAAGGKYAPALSKYRDEVHITDAFREGHDKIFTSSKKIENDPSFVKKWFDGLSEHEQQAAREGARAAVYTEMGVAKNPALAGESIARSDFNKAKMEILFGKEETEKLLKTLADERTIANTHNKIVEGSQTAMRTASKEQFALPTTSEVGKTLLPAAIVEGANIIAGGIGGVGTAAYMGLKGANAAKDAIKLKLAREHNAQYAKLALPVEGPSRDQLIKQLEAFIPQPKLSLLNRVRAALPTP